MTKRVLAFLMVIAMVFSLIPTVVVAEETETATPGYKMILQKAHNQAADLSVEVYLQANTAEQGAVTGYQFDVAVADGLALESAKNDVGGLLKASGVSVLADPAAVTEIEVSDTNKVLIATVDLAGEVPADWTTAFGLTNVEVATAAGTYSDGSAEVTQPGAEGYAGAVTVEKTPFTACEAHEGTWTEFTLPEAKDAKHALAAGNYYLTDNVQLAGSLDLAEAGAEVTICLNGYSITGHATTGSTKGEGIVVLSKAGTFNVCDCTASGEGTAYTAGKLIPTKIKYGGAFRVDNGVAATINMYGGVADGTGIENLAEGSLAWIMGGGTFNMLGGKVVNMSGLNEGNGMITLRGTKPADTLMETNARIEGVTFVGSNKSIVSAPAGGSAAGEREQPNAVSLVVKDITVADSKDGAYAVYNVGNRFKSVIIEGNVVSDAPVLVGEGQKVTLNLGANADVNIATANELTEEQFNERVLMAEGATLTAGTLTYDNAYDGAGANVSYENGKFVFEAGHTIADKYADGIVFKAWEKTDSLPTSGKWYLTADVYPTAIADLSKDLTLDLNGKTIHCDNSKAFRVYAGTLKLFDGTSQFDVEGNWIGAGTGKITGDMDVNGAVQVRAGGTFNLYSGSISGNGRNNSDWRRGAGVYIFPYETNRAKQPGGIFNMYGGEITGNKASQMGAAICAYEGDNVTVPENQPLAQINIYGGKIHGNTTINEADTGARGFGTIYASTRTAVTIAGGEFCDNEARYGGVVALFKDATLNITGGNFHDNTASWGGVVYAGDTSQVKISNITISDNSATGRGGVIAIGNSGTIELDGVTLTGNECSLGAAICSSDGATGTLILKDTVVTGNNSTAGNNWYTCGAVWLVRVNLIVSGKTVIAGNTASHASAVAGWKDLVFNKSTARTSYIQVNELAAGSHINAWQLGAKDLAANQVVTEAAGGSQTNWDCGWINYQESATNDGKTADAEHSGNISRVNGEFVFGHYHGDVPYSAISSAAELTAATAGNYYLAADIATTAAWSPVDGVVLCFNGHTIKSSARPVVSVEGTAAKSTVTFEDCTGIYLANDEYMGGGITTTSTASASGHGMRVAGSNVVNWNGGKIFGNTVKATGAVGGAAMWINGATVKFNGGAVCNNTMTTTTENTIQGIIQINSGTLDINGGSFYGNTTNSAGTAYGVIRRAGGTITIDDAKFFDNEAVYGAVVYGTSTINNCVFRDNHATKSSGAIYGNGTIKNSVFKNNTAVERGGAIYANGSLTVTNTKFIENSATKEGGAIYETDVTAAITITDCEFTRNTAGTNGGAFNAENGAGNITIKGTKFDGNTAASYGGAICTRGNKMTVNVGKNDSGVGCTFTGNTAKNGGAIAWDTYNRYTNTRNIDGAVFKKNTASSIGGAVFMNLGSHASNTGRLTATITDSTFEENTAASAGAAVGARGYLDLLLSDTIIQNNTDESTFGAIYVETDTPNVTLSGRMIVKDNKGKTYPNADIVLRGDSSTLPHLIIADLDPTSQIGINTSNERYDKDHVVTKQPITLAEGTTYEQLDDCFFSGAPDRFRTYVNEDGHLILTKHVAEDGTAYQTLSEAIEAAAAAGETEFQLQAGTTEEITLPAAIEKIDLNGVKAGKITVADGKELTLIDTSTDRYEGGTATVKVDGAVKSSVKVDGKQYIVINDGKGNYSAHRVYASILSRVLRPAAYGAGFKAIFAADEVVAENVEYGIKFSWDKAEGWLPASFIEMESGLPGGTTTPNQKIVSVKNIVTAEDNTHWGATLYGVPYITVNGVEVTGTEQTLVMQTLAEQALSSLSADNEIYQLIEAMMANCGIN